MKHAKLNNKTKTETVHEILNTPKLKNNHQRKADNYMSDMPNVKQTSHQKQPPKGLNKEQTEQCKIDSKSKEVKI